MTTSGKTTTRLHSSAMMMNAVVSTIVLLAFVGTSVTAEEAPDFDFDRPGFVGSPRNPDVLGLIYNPNEGVSQEMFRFQPNGLMPLPLDIWRMYVQESGGRQSSDRKRAFDDNFQSAQRLYRKPSPNKRLSKNKFGGSDKQAFTDDNDKEYSVSYSLPSNDLRGQKRQKMFKPDRQDISQMIVTNPDVYYHEIARRGPDAFKAINPPARPSKDNFFMHFG